VEVPVRRSANGHFNSNLGAAPASLLGCPFTPPDLIARRGALTATRIPVSSDLVQSCRNPPMNGVHSESIVFEPPGQWRKPFTVLGMSGSETEWVPVYARSMWDWRRILILSVVAMACGTIGGFLWGFGSRTVYDLGLPGGEISVVSAMLSGFVVAVIGLGVGVAASCGAIGVIALFDRKMRLDPISRSVVAAIGGGIAAFGLLSLVYRDASYQTQWWSFTGIAFVVTAATFVAVFIACRSSNVEKRASPASS
jgi:hypothetical protein